MNEREQDPYIEWIAGELRRPVSVGAAARARVMAAVREEPLPIAPRTSWRWLLRARTVRFSPIAGVALAAGLVGIGVLLGGAGNRADHRTGGELARVAPGPQQLPVTDTVIKFVFVAPQATRVSIVGDFNQWDAAATPMQRTPTGGTWSVTVPLNTGRHVYAFVINGTQWVADPSAPLAPADGLGVPNSVLLVGGSSS